MAKKVSFIKYVFKSLFDTLPSSLRVSLHDFLNQQGKKSKTLKSNYAHLRAKFSPCNKASLVSVIMPSWNRKDSIAKSIDSVLLQSYKNIELIIADDGSTDNTVDFIKINYEKQINSGEIILISNNHSGVSFTRNSALLLAKGEFIAYLDSDNSWEKDYLLIMVNSLVEKPQFTSCYSGLRIKNYQTGRAEILLEETFSYYNLSQINFIDINAFVHSSLLLKEYGYFDIELSRLVDWDLILRYTKKSSPLMVPIAAVNYYLSNRLNNITFQENFTENFSKVKEKNNRI